MGVQVSVSQKIKISLQMNIVSKKKPYMGSTSTQTETSHRSPPAAPPAAAQGQQKPPGDHLLQHHLHILHLHHHHQAPPSSHWVNLWLSDLHSSLMEAVRKGVSLKKVEVDVDVDVDMAVDEEEDKDVDEGKYAVEATTPGMLQGALLQRRLAVGMFTSGELEEEEDEWEDF